jgi:hypothetical protein
MSNVKPRPAFSSHLITSIIAVLFRVNRMQNAHVVEGRPDCVSETLSFFGTDWRAVIPLRQTSVVRVPCAFAEPSLRYQIRHLSAAVGRVPFRD